MRILVQKFGGTSLSSFEARNRVVSHIKKALANGYRLVVVVSAMGRKGDPYATDTLLELLNQSGGKVHGREKDMLLCCGETISAVQLCGDLQREGVVSTVLNGAQAGILTDDRFGEAQILTVQPSRIRELLEQGRVVIVTGFQGVTAGGDCTTLGRGGSDTTATALGAALHAERVEIFTDVAGVMTADPKLVPDARPLTSATYLEISSMAGHGAKVIHPRAVDLAMKANLPIRIRSTFSDDEGTLVAADVPRVKDRPITGITYLAPVSQIRIRLSEGQYDLQLPVFQLMAREHISVDFINVNPSEIAYTVNDADTERAVRLLEDRGFDAVALRGCAKVAVVGAAMGDIHGMMARIVEALLSEDIAILQSADSSSSVWLLVRNSDLARTLTTLHRAFQLQE